MDGRHLAEELRQVALVRAEQELGGVKGVMTSHDAAVMRARDQLHVGTPFEGFDRWLLPFELGRGDVSIVVAEPESTTPSHAHDDAALHVVVTGSITIDGRELGPGDWAYVPAGVAYSLRAGSSGAVLLYPHWT